MKILYYFPEKPTPMFQWQKVHLFDELLHHNIIVESFNPLQCRNWDEANEKIIQKIKNNHYDMFLTCLCNEHMLYYDTLNIIKKAGLPTVSFRPDNLSIPFNDKKLAPHFDLVWLTAKDTRYIYNRWNVNTIFAPYAANPFVFKYSEKPIKRQLCFIGTPYGSRVKMMKFIAEVELTNC